MAKEHAGHQRVRFGISADPGVLEVALREGDPKIVAENFTAAAEDTKNETGIVSYGTLGLERTIRDFVNEPSLNTWFMVRIADGLLRSQHLALSFVPLAFP